MWVRLGTLCCLIGPRWLRLCFLMIALSGVIRWFCLLVVRSRELFTVVFETCSCYRKFGCGCGSIDLRYLFDFRVLLVTIRISVVVRLGSTCLSVIRRLLLIRVLILRCRKRLTLALVFGLRCRCVGRLRIRWVRRLCFTRLLVSSCRVGTGR